MSAGSKPPLLRAPGGARGWGPARLDGHALMWDARGNRIPRARLPFEARSGGCCGEAGLEMPSWVKEL